MEKLHQHPEEGATMIIDGEKASASFEGDDVIVNGESVCGMKKKSP